MHEPTASAFLLPSCYMYRHSLDGFEGQSLQELCRDTANMNSLGSAIRMNDEHLQGWSTLMCCQYLPARLCNHRKKLQIQAAAYKSHALLPCRPSFKRWACFAAKSRDESLDKFFLLWVMRQQIAHCSRNILFEKGSNETYWKIIRFHCGDSGKMPLTSATHNICLLSNDQSGLLFVFTSMQTCTVCWPQIHERAIGAISPLMSLGSVYLLTQRPVVFGISMDFQSDSAGLEGLCHACPGHNLSCQHVKWF